ncbi:OmpP1/FadL family transporter [Prevotella sp. AGR2160]|uniref:OmpP1/FadL family transporter n=1 Tax=Prevotella sp. AGR2160 TaxID=1280674 RepID=UPI0003FF27B7|nr:hemin receptor [Prevotella sp. AGR2160]
MKTKYALIMSAALLCAAPVAAQETYQDTKLIENELNGTARYVGMGGAMEALGADISTMSTNPAGIGLFRRSQVSLSGGLVAQSGENTRIYNNLGEMASINGNKTNASFDQVGFVWSQRTGRNSFLNLGFNYHKSRNFDQILTAANSLSYASLNKLTAIKYDGGLAQQGSMAWSGLDNSYASLLAKNTDATTGTTSLDYLNGTNYMFGQYQKGYIGEYDFNISGNIHDRVYLGLTFGIHDVNYRSNKYYTEDLENSTFSENRETLKIDGTGYDVKFGAIFRPFEESPFRIGLYVNTPVFYDLTMKGTTDVTLLGSNVGDYGDHCDYDFKVYTPWKFGVSLGHTIDQVLALGFTYEYSDYSAVDNRINNGTYVGWYGETYDSSESDDVMNDNADAVLKGVHTLKLGMEFKPVQDFSVRIGYNYVSPQFKESGFRDQSIQSPGVGYATSADYTNWKATNRLTCGLGYTHQNFSVDLAYQYAQTDGDFYPFMSYDGDKEAANNNIATGSKVSFKRNQVLLTLGYRF